MNSATWQIRTSTRSSSRISSSVLPRGGSRPGIRSWTPRTSNVSRRKSIPVDRKPQRNTVGAIRTTSSAGSRKSRRREKASRGERFNEAGFTLLAAILLSSLTVSARSDDASRPNVLMIIADDLNDWVGCLGGHPDAKNAEHRPAGEARLVVHQRPLRGSGLQPVACGDLYGKTPEQHGHLRQRARLA